MHINKEHTLDHLLAAVEGLGLGELDRLQTAISCRRAALRQSAVFVRRDDRNGVLQLETRAHRRKDGGATERGPYWYFHYRDGGRQRTLYVGKTETPEDAVDEKLGKEH